MSGKINEISMSTDKYYFSIIICPSVLLPPRASQWQAGDLATTGMVK